MSFQSAPKSEEDASKKNFQFWSTQPVREQDLEYEILAWRPHKNVQVPALEEVITSNECISQDVPTEEVNNQYKIFLSLSMAQKYFHRFGKSHIVSQMVSNGTPCSWTIPWCSKRLEWPNYKWLQWDTYWSGLRVAQWELRRGRWQHVQIRLQVGSPMSNYHYL